MSLLSFFQAHIVTQFAVPSSKPKQFHLIIYYLNLRVADCNFFRRSTDFWSKLLLLGIISILSI